MRNGKSGLQGIKNSFSNSPNLHSSGSRYWVHKSTLAMDCDCNSCNDDGWSSASMSLSSETRRERRGRVVNLGQGAQDE